MNESPTPTAHDAHAWIQALVENCDKTTREKLMLIAESELLHRTKDPKATFPREQKIAMLAELCTNPGFETLVYGSSKESIAHHVQHQRSNLEKSNPGKFQAMVTAPRSQARGAGLDL